MHTFALFKRVILAVRLSPPPPPVVLQVDKSLILRILISDPLMYLIVFN